ncbi:superoxide dismutase family protein [Piscinibacter terrae]|uniref:Superoxide dismutase [Cu-Zn] n=1 Tax=Piscinibacter terrae TaxID=2496871 RepID=A0A3N7JRP3_9BURK|nr:superoxide dismutase family protein [Albitalea terrae]RQP23669.1 superoxide dismutase family protein [Albitalea terrae]
MNARTSLAILAAAAALSACGTFGSSGPKAVATLEPTKGNAVAGTVTFQQKGDKVLVTANITGLAPNSEHGFHAHEKGDCSSGDGMSTAGHFNPSGKPHGPQDHDHHAGDFPGLTADASGNVNTSFELSGVSIGSGTSDLVGRGLIVHAGPDDYKTQPTGNSGARVACGVIKAS